MLLFYRTFFLFHAYRFSRDGQPWLLEVMLSVEYVKQLGYSALDGIDVYFLQRAKQAKTPILQLESMEIQLNALAGASIPMQVESLKNTLKSLEDGEALFNQLLCAWWEGDADKMFELSLMQQKTPSAASDAMIERLINQRNIPMAEKIKGYLNQQGHFFVIVGALHLGGDQGLIPLLQAQGFNVKQIPYQPVAAQ